VVANRLLLSLDEMQQYDRARVFLDEDFTAVEKFTVSTDIGSVIGQGDFELSISILIT